MNAILLDSENRPTLIPLDKAPELLARELIYPIGKGGHTFRLGLDVPLHAVTGALKFTGGEVRHDSREVYEIHTPFESFKIRA